MTWGLDVVRKISLESEYCRRFRNLLEAFASFGSTDLYLSCLQTEAATALREYRERVDAINQDLREDWEDDSENDAVVLVDSAAE